MTTGTKISEAPHAISGAQSRQADATLPEPGGDGSQVAVGEKLAVDSLQGKRQPVMTAQYNPDTSAERMLNAATQSVSEQSVGELPVTPALRGQAEQRAVALAHSMTEPESINVIRGNGILVVKHYDGQVLKRIYSVQSIDVLTGSVVLKDAVTYGTIELSADELASHLSQPHGLGWEVLEEPSASSSRVESSVEINRRALHERSIELFDQALRKASESQDLSPEKAASLQLIGQRMAELTRTMDELTKARALWRSTHALGPISHAYGLADKGRLLHDPESLKAAPQERDLRALISQLNILGRAQQNLVFGKPMTAGLSPQEVGADPILYNSQATTTGANNAPDKGPKKGDERGQELGKLTRNNASYLLNKAADAVPLEIILAYHAAVAPYLETLVDGESVHRTSEHPSLTKAINNMIERGAIDNDGVLISSAEQLEDMMGRLTRKHHSIKLELEILNLPEGRTLMWSGKYRGGTGRGGGHRTRQSFRRRLQREAQRLRTIESHPTMKAFTAEGGRDILKQSGKTVAAAHQKRFTQDLWDQAYDAASIVDDYPFWAMMVIGGGISARYHGTRAIMKTLTKAISKGKSPTKLKQMLYRNLATDGVMFHGTMNIFHIATGNLDAMDWSPVAFLRSVALMTLLGGAGARQAWRSAVTRPGPLRQQLQNMGLLGQELGWMSLVTAMEHYVHTGEFTLAGDALKQNIQFLLAMRVVGATQKRIDGVRRNREIESALAQARSAHTAFQLAKVSRQPTRALAAHLNAGLDALRKLPHSLRQGMVGKSTTASKKFVSREVRAARAAALELLQAHTLQDVKNIVRTLPLKSWSPQAQIAFQQGVGRAVVSWATNNLDGKSMLEPLQAWAARLAGGIAIPLKADRAAYAVKRGRRAGVSVERLVARTKPRAPTEQYVNPQFVERLAKCKGPVLVIGSFPVDADSVGSALALARALRMRGVKAYAVFDGELPASLRQLGRGDLLRSSDPAIQRLRFKTAVVVDGGEVSARRLGAVASRLAEVDTVITIDHHNVLPTAESLGLSRSQTHWSWQDTSADSASSMVLSLVGHLEAKAPIPFSKAKWQFIGDPVAAGILTDTGYGYHLKTASEAAVGQLSWLVKVKGLNLADTRARLAWTLPREAKQAIERDIKFVELTDADAPRKVVALSVPKQTLETALKKARAFAPKNGIAARETDVVNFFQDILDRLVPPGMEPSLKAPEVGILMVESGKGSRVMMRSRSEGSLVGNLIDGLQGATSMQGGAKAFSGGGFWAGAHPVEAQNLLGQYLHTHPDALTPSVQ